MLTERLTIRWSYHYRISKWRGYQPCWWRRLWRYMQKMKAKMHIHVAPSPNRCVYMSAIRSSWRNNLRKADWQHEAGTRYKKCATVCTVPNYLHSSSRYSNGKLKLLINLNKSEQLLKIARKLTEYHSLDEQMAIFQYGIASLSASNSFTACVALPLPFHAVDFLKMSEHSVQRWTLFKILL